MTTFKEIAKKTNDLNTYLADKQKNSNLTRAEKRVKDGLEEILTDFKKILDNEDLSIS